MPPQPSWCRYIRQPHRAGTRLPAEQTRGEAQGWNIPYLLQSTLIPHYPLERRRRRSGRGGFLEEFFVEFFQQRGVMAEGFELVFYGFGRCYGGES